MAFEEIWPDIKSFVEQLLEDTTKVQVNQQQWMHYYSVVYNYASTTPPVQQRSGELGALPAFRGRELYDGLRECISTYMDGVAEETRGQVYENLLYSYRKEWNNFQFATKLINSIFKYLNDHWLFRERQGVHKDVLQIKHLAKSIWLNTFYEGIRDALTAAIMNEIQRFREREQIDTRLLKDVVESFVAMAFSEDSTDELLYIYEEKFETPFLEQTNAHYQTWAADFLSSNPLSDFITRVERIFRLEEENGAVYLRPSTQAKLSRALEEILILANMDHLREEFPGLLEQNKSDDLRRLYLLLRRIEGALDPVLDVWYEYVKADLMARLDGLEERANTKAVKQDFKPYVDTFLEAQTIFRRIVAGTFENDHLFMDKMGKAFEHALNQSGNRSPEFVSLYLDDLLKPNKAGITEEDLDEIVDNLLGLFSYLEEKDLFQAYYKKHLSARLLGGRSASSDIEDVVIGKLKGQMGSSFTHQLEAMFKDVQLSYDLMQSFLSRDTAAKLPLEFSIQVLTTGMWPSHSESSFSLSNELLTCCKAFERFYLNSHSGRKLLWQPTMGDGELTFRTDAGKKHSVSCTTTQMVLLLQFNERDTYTLAELKEITNLDDNSLKKDLCAVALNKKLPILQKNPPSKKFQPTDEFTFNSAFKAKKFKFKIPKIVVKETEAERGVTLRQQEDARAYVIDAAVVRIMKMRKTMDHSSLVAEVITQLRHQFHPKVSAIKRQIEKLIEREYLERSTTSNKVYNYLA